MTLSIYTYLFTREGNYYLYNSQTGFLSSIPESFYEILFNRDFEKIDEEILYVLKEKKIIVEEEHKYDYYYSSRLKYLSSIGIQDSLGLVIVPTTGCNFACPYCFEGEKENCLMSPEVINNLIHFINSYQEIKKIHLTWYGGEPLITFDTIKRVVERIKKDCATKEIISQSIVTNGYLINDEIIDFMKVNRFTSIQITFDGAEDNHNHTRFLKGSKKPTFGRILKNVEKLAERMSDKCRISLRINVNKDNEEDFIYMYKWIKKKFPINKNIQVYPGFIREVTKDNNKMCYKSLYRQARFNFYKTALANGVNVDIYPKQTEKGCMICNNGSLIIGPSGEIYKCWNDVNHREKIVGNIKDKYMTNPSLICHYAYDSCIYHDSRCKECKLFPVCNGGCGWQRYQNLFGGKEFDVCSYLADDSCLEECLLMSAQKRTENAIMAY